MFHDDMTEKRLAFILSKKNVYCHEDKDYLFFFVHLDFLSNVIE
jgi:hypothetical protein